MVLKRKLTLFLVLCFLVLSLCAFSGCTSNSGILDYLTASYRIDDILLDTTKDSIIEIFGNPFETIEDGNTLVWYNANPSKIDSVNALYITFDADSKVCEVSYVLHNTLSQWNGSNDQPNIPSKATRIGQKAFYNNSTITSIVLNNIVEIQAQAFSGCENLESIYIPKPLSSIKASAFSGCPKLKEVTIESLPDWYNVDIENAPAAPTYNGADIYTDSNLLTEVTIPESVTKIKPYLFTNCQSILTITMSDNLSTIDSYCFKGCTLLSTIAFNDKLGIICEGAFQECPSITSIIIPDEVLTISQFAFAYCTSLKNVTIGGEVKVIEKYAFIGSGLTSVQFPVQSKWKVNYSPNALTGMEIDVTDNTLNASNLTSFKDGYASRYWYKTN